MAEGSENHWLVPRSWIWAFGQQILDIWNISQILCKIKLSCLGSCKLSVSSELWENNNCVHNVMSQSSVPSMWCTLYGTTFHSNYLLPLTKRLQYNTKHAQYIKRSINWPCPQYKHFLSTCKYWDDLNILWIPGSSTGTWPVGTVTCIKVFPQIWVRPK